MPRYSYIALNQQHQKLTGVLSADNEQNAREKLHAMAFSVVSLKEESGADYQQSAESGVLTFFFVARDIRGKEAKGTIDALDRKTAFRRLVAEYNFEILALGEATLSEEERLTKGTEGIEQLAEEVEEEFGVVFKKQEFHEENEQKISESFLERKKELVQSVEEIVQQSRDLLEKFKDDMTGDELHAIKARMDDLMRMRLSNNLKYIQDLSDELLTLVDEALRRHARNDEESKEIARDIADEITDETLYQNASEEIGVLGNLRQVSRRFDRMLRGYKRTHVSKASRQKALDDQEIQNGFFLKVRLGFRLFKRSLFHLFRILFSKNSAVRRQHLEQLRVNFSVLFALFPKSTAEVIAVEKDLDSLEKNLLVSSNFSFQKTLFRWIEELHLFCGWVLSFYIMYFYLGIFLMVKGGGNSDFFAFLERSLTNPFPFLVTGVIFFLFLGLTLSIRFAAQKFWLSPLFFGFSTFLSILFIFNF